MTGAWWTRDATPNVRSSRGTGVPELVPADRDRLLADFDTRIAGFTPEWTGRGPTDAGDALRLVFAEQLEAVAQRLNRWPGKALGEFLSDAGIEPYPGTVAKTLLAFEVNDAAAQSIFVPPGFQAAGSLPGVDTPVIFETDTALYVAPARLGEVFVEGAAGFTLVNPESTFAAFGEQPSTSSALWIGLAGTAAPTSGLTLYFDVTSPSDRPPPSGAGGIAPELVPPGPVLRWEIVDGGRLLELDVVRDETANLARAGLVELALPGQWRAGQPAGIGTVASNRWLRVRIAYGAFAVPPRLRAVMVNIIRASGARTVHDEVPVPVGGAGGRRRRLSQVPVVPGSLDLQIDESALSGTGRLAWTEVPDLLAAGPDDAVYQFDPVGGILRFGDGVHGRVLPLGFRNVHAMSYQVRSNVPDTLPANLITVMVTAILGISKVTNPLPGNGGGPSETDAQVRLRGPLEIRTRDRAVTPADYALMALRASGAQISRAFAVPGLDPRFPGALIPGVVAVFVVPPDRGDSKPIPDPETLRAVATSLSVDAAPAGIEVVAAAPTYHDVTVEAGILLRHGADAPAAERKLLQALSKWLHPITGGDDGKGWPVGGTIHHARLLRLITHIPGVRAAPRLNVVLDGLRQPACQDVPLPPYSLLWPVGHQILILDAAGSS